MPRIAGNFLCEVSSGLFRNNITAEVIIGVNPDLVPDSKLHRKVLFSCLCFFLDAIHDYECKTEWMEKQDLRAWALRAPENF